MGMERTLPGISGVVIADFKIPRVNEQTTPLHPLLCYKQQQNHVYTVINKEDNNIFDFLTFTIQMDGPVIMHREIGRGFSGIHITVVVRDACDGKNTNNYYQPNRQL